MHQMFMDQIQSKPQSFMKYLNCLLNNFELVYDISFVFHYHSTLHSLRANDGTGRLLVDENDLLPKIPNLDMDAMRVAGDVRALEMPGLATMHTLWVR